MSARLRPLGPPGDRLAFGPRPAARAGFAFVFLMLLASLLLNWDSAVDLSVGRLPLTGLYLLLTAGALAGVLASRRIIFDRERSEAVRQVRFASMTLSASAQPLPRNLEIRVRREGDGVSRTYVLEAAGDGAAVRIEAGPLRSVLEPPGREIAKFLGVPFRAAAD